MRRTITCRKRLETRARAASFHRAIPIDSLTGHQCLSAVSGSYRGKTPSWPALSLSIRRCRGWPHDTRNPQARPKNDDFMVCDVSVGDSRPNWIRGEAACPRLLCQEFMRKPKIVRPASADDVFGWNPVASRYCWPQGGLEFNVRCGCHLRFHAGSGIGASHPHQPI